MKRLFRFFLGIIFFLSFLSNSNNVFAVITSCETTIEEKTITIKVFNIENYLKENPNYDSLYIWVMRKTPGFDREMGSRQITKSGEYTFDRTGWPDDNNYYVAQINTPPAGIFKPYGDSTGSGCNFMLSSTVGNLPASELCCPDGYQNVGCPKVLPYHIWDPHTECCRETFPTFWDFKDKIPCNSSALEINVMCQNGEGVKTALGCIPIKPGGFTNWLLRFAIGIGGGIALLLIIFGALQIIFSGGNPDRVKAGKEMITAAIAGLFLIIFAVVILKLIGQDILQIPGFG